MSAPRPATPFGRRLHRLRTAAGLTQSDLAQRLGVSAARIGHLETGRYGPPSLDLTIRLAAALGCDPSELDGRLAPRRAGTKGR